jgi:undecaprenyl diphosphate synthase
MTLKIPRHVAIILDGNGRWARMKRMPRLFGHREGIKAVRKAVEFACEKKLKYLTLFAFSIENWGRPKSEVDALMGLLKEYLSKEIDEMMERDIRFNVIGNLKMLPSEVQKRLIYCMDQTKRNGGLTLTLALSYSGRDEIIRAVKRMVEDGKSGKITEEIDDELFQSYLDSPSIPDPDLLIRTSGELRISNFMLWQLAYTEIYISEKLWPQFTKKEFNSAINEFNRRKRRFGLTEAQTDVPS